MSSLAARLRATSSWRSILIIRFMVGAVFLSEGIQKFLFAAQVGAGRFERIGLPAPHVLGPFVGATEILCGALVLLGAWTRVTVMPLLIIMTVAIISTKVPILLESGFWKMAHDSRNDFAMTLGSLFLLLNGAGPFSLDGRGGAAPRD